MLRADAAAASAEAERLRGIARRAQARAQDIDPLLDAATGLLVPETWQGASARRCAEQLSDHQGRLASARADVEDACDRIRLRARDLDDRATALLGDAQRLEGEAAARTSTGRGRAVPIQGRG